MSKISIEKPTQEKLDSLGVNSWSIWECEPSTFDWQYSENESAYVLEGKVTVTTENGETVEINKGDFVRFPKGLKCKWNVIDKIRKHYTFD